jgi:hypothetical protein
MFNFFRKRRERESALGASPAAPSEALGSFARSEGQPVVGQQLGGTQVGGVGFAGGADLTEALTVLSQLGPMVQQAIAQGNVTVEQGEAQTIDMRGTGLREDILGIMQQHGIDAEAGTANQAIDASAYGDMQQQLLEALAKHGIDPNSGGSSVSFQISTDDETQPGAG